MFKTGLKVLAIVALVVGIAYAGVTCYANFIVPQSQTLAPKAPQMQEADSVLTVASTGRILFFNSKKAEHYGTVHILHGFWEIAGKEYLFRNRDLILDEKVFGKITISKRIKS